MLLKYLEKFDKNQMKKLDIQLDHRAGDVVVIQDGKEYTATPERVILYIIHKLAKNGIKSWDGSDDPVPINFDLEAKDYCQEHETVTISTDKGFIVIDNTEEFVSGIIVSVRSEVTFAIRKLEGRKFKEVFEPDCVGNKIILMILWGITYDCNRARNALSSNSAKRSNKTG